MRQNKKLIRRASGSFKARQEKDAIDDAVKLAPKIGRKILKQPSLHIFLFANIGDLKSNIATLLTYHAYVL